MPKRAKSRPSLTSERIAALSPGPQPLPPLTTHDFRRWIREINKLCPTKYPVSVRRVAMPNDRVGDCAEYPTSWRIRIASHLDRASTADTLVHEWAHVLRDETGVPPVWDPVEGCWRDHDELYWQLHGQVWCKFYGSP